MRRFLLSSVGLVIMVVCLGGGGAIAGDGSFETLFAGRADMISYIYFEQDGDYFIDSELRTSLETFRYRRFYFLVDFNHEVYMGRKYNSNMVFDPNRGSWSFGLAGRYELDKYYVETQMHHDCYHDIGRWMSVDYSIYWNTPRIGFGTIDFLPKRKYSRPDSGGRGLVWKNKIDYQFMAGFFAPRGESWQKNHDYEFTLTTDFRYQLARYSRLGFDIESNNLWVINSGHNLKSRHGLNFNFTIYGNSGALMTYIAWWPEDTQSIRNRDGKAAFGLHFVF